MSILVNLNNIPNKNFNDETAKIIWNKLKGKDVPETYSDKDKEEIVKHYWHRAMESEQ